MSLINDALKRAQQEREKAKGRVPASEVQTVSPLAPGQAGAPVPLSYGTGGGRMNFLKALVGLVIAGSVLASAVAFILFLWVNMDSSPQAEPAVQDREIRLSLPVATSDPGPSEAPVATRPAPADTAESPGPDAVTLSNQALTRQLDAAPTVAVQSRVDASREAPDPSPPVEPVEDATARLATPKPAPVQAVPEPVAVASTTPAVTEIATDSVGPGLVESPKLDSVSTPESPPAAPVIRDGPVPELEEFIRNARVSAVRMAGPASKIVMNNRVYRLNELIPGLQIPLKIVDIQRREIVFQDEYGQRYTKRF